jgi:hypothetical protein
MIIQSRYKNTQAEWESSTIILAKGEAGVAIDTGKVRYGNGADTWANLPDAQTGVSSVGGQTGDITSLSKSIVGLDQVDNTSDANKPISSAQAAVNITLSNAIADIASSGGATKESIGLGNVDNTSDANKPISNATQIALNLKAPLNNPSFTGNVQGITKSMVGLAQVDNTSDLNKPISNATQAALNTKASSTDPRLTDTRTPTDGSVTNAKVATGAGISLDKTADSATRLAMTPAERATVAELSDTVSHIEHGVITAGDGALASFTDEPNESAIVAIGPNALGSATTIDTAVAVGDNAMSDGTNITNSVALGDNALQKMSGSTENIAIGTRASTSLTSASRTIAIGKQAGGGRNNNGDISIGVNANNGLAFVGLSGDWEVHGAINTNVAVDTPNIAVGVNALHANSGSENIAVGGNALSVLTSDTQNTALGINALKTLGSDVGPTGLQVVTVGQNGTYAWSGANLTISAVDTDVQAGDIVVLSLSNGTFSSSGYVRGIVDEVVDANTFTVTEALSGVPIQELDDEGNVTVVSYERDAYTGSSKRNIALGYAAGSGLVSGEDNLFIGYNAGPAGAVSTDGIIAIGKNAFANPTSLTNSIAIGTLAGEHTTNATDTVLLGNGTNTVDDVTNGVAVGTNASLTDGDAVSIGHSASAGQGGVAIGKNAEATNNGIALGNSTNSDGSVVIGTGITATGGNAVAIGNGSTAGSGTIVVGNAAEAEDNGIAIGASATAGEDGVAIGNGITAASNTVELGSDTNVTHINGATIELGSSIDNANITIGSTESVVNIGTTNTSGVVNIHGQLVTIDDAGTTSDERDKTDIRTTSLGLDFINSVDPVEFRWAKRDENEEGTRFHQGVIAQQVKEAADRAGVDFGGYVDQSVNGGPDKLMVRYDEFVAPLIKAVQELSERVEYLEGRLNSEAW